jgi:hypothetical protein
METKKGPKRFFKWRKEAKEEKLDQIRSAE